MVVGAPFRDGPTGKISQGAAYLYQKDLSGSWQFIKKLLSSDGEGSDFFGTSVAISGTTVVVGVPYADVSPNFDQGSAYIFERDQGGSNNWGEVKKLVARDGKSRDYFGQSIAVRGNLVVVGAVGVNKGSAFLFSRNVGGTNNWGQVRRLNASDGAADDYFGSSVAISGTTVIVGASSDAVGTNFRQGSAYIFERDQGGSNTWGQVKKLVASDGAGGDEFGYSVAISGTTIIVGAVGDDVGTNSFQGSAYIFQRDQGGSNNWGQVKKLVANDGAENDFFGWSVSISNNMMVVGAPSDDYKTIIDQGSAYVFNRNAGGSNTWGQFKKLTASDRANNNYFGNSVTISGSVIGVGSNMDNIDSNVDQGSVYIY